MKPIKMKTSKLSLNKTTIRMLDNDTLPRAVGGVPPPYSSLVGCSFDRHCCPQPP